MKPDQQLPIEDQMLGFVDKTKRQQLIAKYNLDSAAFDQFAFTRSQLIDFLRAHPQYTEQFVSVAPPVLTMHDVQVLERRRHYHVYWVDRGRKRGEKVFEDLFEALNAYFVSEIPEPQEDARLRQEHLTKIANANTIDEIDA